MLFEPLYIEWLRHEVSVQCSELIQMLVEPVSKITGIYWGGVPTPIKPVNWALSRLYRVTEPFWTSESEVEDYPIKSK